MIKLSSSQPRVSLSLVKGTVPLSTISAQSISFRSSRSHSACGICRNFPPNNGATNKLILPTMSKCSVVARFHTHCYKEVVSLSSGRKRGDGRRRTISTVAPLISKPAPLVVHYPSSSLPLSAQLTPSEAPQRSDEWFALRKDKLTTSTFSTALGFWKGSRRFELWHDKVYASSDSKIVEGPQRSAMDWGVRNESTAIERYKTITGREVSSLSFATHSDEKFDWIGASPDGLLGSLPAGGILEVKCPYNKGKPETALPWDKMPFYYMPQVQGQMEVMDREWVDLYCWTPNGSTIFRVCRARGYWDVIHGVLREFWWENVIPARESLAIGKEEDAKSYKPTSTHKLTGLAIAKSIELAVQAKLICREIAGHVEYFR